MSCVQKRPRSISDTAAPKAAGNIGPASLTMSQTRRRRFYIFVQVLLARLAREDVERLNQAKEIIRHCTQRHKDGDPRYERLVDAVHMELRQFFGPAVIRETEGYLTNQLKIPPASSRSA